MAELAAAGRIPDTGRAVATSEATDEGLREFCTFHEDYVSRNIVLADLKAGLMLLAFSSALALILNDSGFQAKLVSLGLFPSTGYQFSWNLALALFAVLACGLGTALAFWVLLPRLSNWKRGGQPRGFVFWGDVSNYSPAGNPGSYARTILALPDRVLIEGRLDHLQELSTVCAAKMHWLVLAMRVGGGGAVVAFLWLITEG